MVASVTEIFLIGHRQSRERQRAAAAPDRVENRTPKRIRGSAPTLCGADKLLLLPQWRHRSCLQSSRLERCVREGLVTRRMVRLKEEAREAQQFRREKIE